MAYGALTAFLDNDGIPPSELIATAVLPGGCPLNCPFCIVNEQDMRRAQPQVITDYIIGRFASKLYTKPLVSVATVGDKPIVSCCFPTEVCGRNGAVSQPEDGRKATIARSARMKKRASSNVDTPPIKKIRDNSGDAVRQPIQVKSYFVSYAWGDETEEGREREAVVDRFCEQAEAQGISIIRDKNVMLYGDRISNLMKRIASGDRVFVFLSHKYLCSTYCMSELFDIWRNCREDEAEFIARTRVYVLPCALIGTPIERGQYAVYWRMRFDELDKFVKQHSQFALSDKDNADYRRMTRFVNETANILTLVQDVLRPHKFEDFVKYGFDNPAIVGN